MALFKKNSIAIFFFCCPRWNEHADEHIQKHHTQFCLWELSVDFWWLPKAIIGLNISWLVALLVRGQWVKLCRPCDIWTNYNQEQVSYVQITKSCFGGPTQSTPKALCVELTRHTVKVLKSFSVLVSSSHHWFVFISLHQYSHVMKGLLSTWSTYDAW